MGGWSEIYLGSLNKPPSFPPRRPGGGGVLNSTMPCFSFLTVSFLGMFKEKSRTVAILNKTRPNSAAIIDRSTSSRKLSALPAASDAGPDLLPDVRTRWRFQPRGLQVVTKPNHQNLTKKINQNNPTKET